MTTTSPETLLALARGTDTLCGCGRPLIPYLDSDGKQIGLTHTLDDDDWHMEFWSGMRLDVP